MGAPTPDTTGPSYFALAGLAAARGFEGLSGRLTFTPDAEHGRYIYTGEATYGRLLNGVIPTVARPMVPPG